MTFEEKMRDVVEFIWDDIEFFAPVILFVLIFCGSIVLIITSITVYDLECLEDIAEPMCEEYDQVFKRVSGVQFSCYVGNERQNDYERYNFLDEERERCVEDSR